ncbi:hypothetical protein UA08_06306 [Talaromyces atroroseus]|uniref:Tyrosinase copper-binding domain-containing protein n=1 Tax=Talaromyces atroroseus TaxID=1441469 RepID=A0A225AUA1_TALAT|nr:hypothetical protein UA08_06306 [Talaromyces atroroseus]OKL58516.1 hypothetical protein UA08_06306 [Talaromyces atroroseus]
MKDIDASTKIDDDSDEPLLPAEHNPPRHTFLQYYALDSLTSRPSNTHCQTPTVRLEWRSLSLEARENYITAIQCLSKRPSRLGLNTTRYDDFVYSHLNVSGDTHDAPILLPWHRLYVQRYEDALRSECDYEDPLPYWDWTLDTSNPAHSPVWSSRFGLGGNGTEPKNCLTDGPLASMKPQYPEPHCLRRNFTGENMHAAEYTSAIIEDIISNASTYHDFRLRLERGPHRFVHVGIGGEMPTLWSSNGILIAFLRCFRYAALND